MSKLRLNMMMSLDGFVAGPDQGAENPFGIGGVALTEWLAPLKAFRELEGEQGGEVNASRAVVESWTENIGATVMGRNMFGGGPGPWGDGFHFVTDGIESALEQAKDAAAGKDVSLGGGATAGDAPALPRRIGGQRP